MKILRIYLAAVLFTISGIALAQQYGYFAPGGALSCTGPCTQQTVNLASGSSFITGTLPQSNILTCAANQVVFDNASGTLACSSNINWTDSTGTLATQTPGANTLESWKNTNGLTNQKNWRWFFDTTGNTDRLHLQLLDDAGGNPTDAMIITRNGVDATACQVVGGAVPGYKPCTIQFLNNTLTWTFSLNSTLYSCSNNDDCNFSHTALNAGTTAFVQESANTGSNAGKVGWHTEGLSANATNASAAGAPPSCTGSPTLPYICHEAWPKIIYQVGSGTGLAGQGNGVTYLFTNNLSGVVTTNLGDNSNGSSATDIRCGVLANCTVAGVPIVATTSTQTLSNKTITGHIAFTGTAPAVSACGTGPSIDANASDTTGTVTVGTVAAASCTVTFAVPYTTFNHCRITSQSAVASFAYSYTLSAITVTGTSLVSDKFDYQCDGT